MSHPFQCILYCSRTTDPVSKILVAASGPSIHTFDVSNGVFLSTWPPPKDSESTHDDFERPESSPRIVLSPGGEQCLQPLQKRQKLSQPEHGSANSSIDIVVEGEADGLKRILGPPIVKLAATSCGQYIVAVTGEDKCIRLFEMTTAGSLRQISERIMPKRPCAVVLTQDDSTILCADKFGDVYSLPLIGKLDEQVSEVIDAVGKPMSQDLDAARNTFVPSATSLTVHTKKNLDALRQQQNITRKKAEKKALNFDHQLLLGHVSLLTDVACVSLTSSTHKPREYILTSDRDEHIRISRGIPQTHIIEGYCLGHTQFISKLSIPPSNPQTLISGGGDDYLLLWNWLAGSIKQKIDLKCSVDDFKRRSGFEHGLGQLPSRSPETEVVEDDEVGRIAVTSIKILERSARLPEIDQTEVVITCEGIPALFMYALTDKAGLEYRNYYGVEGNIIDSTVLHDRRSIIYSMDTVHKSISTTTVHSDGDQKQRPSVGAIFFNVESQTWEKDKYLPEGLLSAMDERVKSQQFLEKHDIAKIRSLRELLYNIESLRKRGQENEIDV